MYTDLHVTKVKVWSGSEWRNIFQGSKSTSCPLNYIEYHICEMGYIEKKKKFACKRGEWIKWSTRRDFEGATYSSKYFKKHSVFTWRHDSHLVTKRRLCMLVSMSEINPVGVDPPINLHSCCAACQVTIRTLAWYFLRDSSSPVYNATMPSCILCVQRSEVGGKALNSISFCDGVAGRYVTVEIAPSACRCTKCVKKPCFLAA